MKIISMWVALCLVVGLAAGCCCKHRGAKTGGGACCAGKTQ